MCYTKLQDSEIRLQQYKTALNWYLENTTYPIIFVENSNTYIGQDYQQYINSGRIEFITFDGNSYPRYLGKGYGEALILKKAIAESILLKNCKLVIKITGRLILTNINQLVAESNKQHTISSLTYLNNKKSCASFIIIFPPFFLKDFFLKEMDKINDSNGVYFEHVLYIAIIKWIKSGYKFHFFYHSVDIIGESGSNGRNYPRKTFISSIKNFIKAFYINIIRNEQYIYGMNK